jgi:hypothetical protein
VNSLAVQDIPAGHLGRADSTTRGQTRAGLLDPGQQPRLLVSVEFIDWQREVSPDHSDDAQLLDQLAAPGGLRVFE